MNNQDNLIIDTDTFDFFSLNDITDEERAEYAPQAPQTSKEPLTKASDIGANGGVVDDASDLSDLFENDEEQELQQEQAKDPNNSVADLLSEDDAENAVQIFNDLPEDTPININGRALTKNEVSEIINQIDSVKAERQVISEAAKNIDQIDKFLVQDYHRHQLAIDINIQNIQNAMNSGVSETEYGQLARKLQAAKEAREDLNYRTDEKMRLLEEEKKEIVKFRINQEIQTLSNVIPEWQTRRGQVIKHAIESGVNLYEVEKVWTPELAHIFHDAYCFRKQREKAKSTALERAQAKAPRSTSSANTQQRTKAEDAQAKRLEQLRHKMRNGGLDETDTSNMFQFLKD